MKFPTSHKKVKRAKKHIGDLATLLAEFNGSDFYTVSIDNNPKRGTNFLCFEIREFSVEDAALIIGDALHNLRSALDILYVDTVIACGGTTSDWTRFPVFDSRDELVPWLECAFEKKQITRPIVDLICDHVKPYFCRDSSIWALHHLDIADKHRFLVPTAKYVGCSNIRLEDQKGNKIGHSFYVMDESCRIRLRDADNRKVTIKDKGKSSAQIFFGDETPLGPQNVISALLRLSEEITRTIKAFDLLFPAERDVNFTDMEHA